MGKKPKMIRDKLKDKIINDIWTLFEAEEEKKKEKNQRKRKKHNETIIKDRIIRNIRTLLEPKKRTLL